MTDTEDLDVTRTLAISLYDSLRGAPVAASVTVEELIDTLTTPEPCASKEAAPCWSPITYRADRRLASEAVAVSALVYDLDHVTSVQLEACSAALETRGWRYALHETWTPGRYRLALPLAVDLRPRDYPAAWEACRAALSVPADPSGRDLARLFFAPSHPEGEARVATSGGLVLLDASILLNVSKPSTFPVDSGEMGEPQARGANSASGPLEKSNKFLDLENLRVNAKGLKDVELRGIMRGFLDSTLELKKGTRDNTIHRIASTLPMISTPPVSPEQALALFEPVLVTMEGKDEEGEDYWRQKFSASYERGFEFRRARDEADAKVRARFQPSGEGGDEWKARLILGEKERPIAHVANTDLILQHDPELRGHVRFNELRRGIEVTGGPLAYAPSETCDVALQIHLARSEYGMRVSRSDAGAALLHQALQNPRNPLKDYFETLEWDGKPRITRALHRYCRAAGNDKYIETISRKFFVGCVARALRPGCQLDTVLVLHGGQGIGKTSFVRVLGGEFATETKVDVHNKDAVMIASSSWLVELSELASMRGQEIESVRAFLTTRTDRIRLPYAKEVGEYPRRCAFVGTTNDAQALSDADGNRRFWVVSVGNIDLKALEADRAQLWAEAKAAFEAGEQWWLTSEEQATSDVENQVYQADNPVDHQIHEWLAHQKYRPLSLSAYDVATQVLNMLPAQVTQPVLRSIARGMRQMGWKPTKQRRAGKTLNAFRVPDPSTEEALDESKGND